MSVEYIKKRIRDIIQLKKERHFVPGFILGSYGIVMLSTMMAYWTFLFFGKVQNPFFDSLMPVGSLFMPMYVAVITIVAGKEIIWCHMMMLRQLDRLTKWIIDKYSMQYFKKHKKDPPIIDLLAKIQYKIFGRVTQMTPKKRKKIVIAAIGVWVAWVVLGRTDAIDLLFEVKMLFLLS